MTMRVSIACALIFLVADGAAAEQIRTRTGKTWLHQGECWATIFPTVRLFTEEFGAGKLVANSDVRIEYEVVEAQSGRTVLRAGCEAIPGLTPQTFKRFLEVTLP